MKKKLLVKIFGAIAAISLAFGVAGCENNSAAGGGERDNDTPSATEPSDTQKPGGEQEPGTPETPGTPDDGGKDTPENPGDNNPETPDDDGKDTPDNPGEDNPGTPDTPDDPDKPETPDHFGENEDFRYWVKSNQVTIVKWLNKNKSEAIIPETIEGKPVTTIADLAFYKTRVKKVVIPDSVTSIGDGAFIKCDQYNKKDDLNYLGNSKNPYLYLAETANRDITTAKIDENCRFIGEEAFQNCKKLTNVTIPDSVISVDNNVFTGCENLVYNVKDGLKYLGNSENQYYYLAGTTSTDMTTAQIDVNCRIIGSYAFQDCTKLTNIAIPNGVITIERAAFYNCGIEKIEIPDSTMLVDSGFWECSNLTSISVAKDNPKYHSAGNCVIETATKTLVAGCGDSVISVDGSVKSIGFAAFAGCGNLTNIVIPDSVTFIDDWAFTDSNKLTDIVIPNSVTSIGNSAFYNCSGLTRITIGNSVTSIGNSAFEDCSALATITIPDSVTSIGYGAFSRCSALASITIPDSVTSIGNSTFYNCSGLTSVTIPNSVISIGESVFDGCSKLVYNVKENLKYLGSAQNPYLYLVGVTSTSTTEANIDTNCRFIGDSAFYYCSGLVSITIPNSVTSIGRAAFWECSGLTNITIPNSVTSIGYSAFSWCSGLTSITIPNSVKYIGGYAFRGCSGLKSVTIGNGVTSIDYGAFDGCGGLEKVYFKGSAEEWDKISISSYNEELNNAARYYYSETKPTGSGNFWHYGKDGEIAEW